jgi:hypothetical protein
MRWKAALFESPSSRCRNWKSDAWPRSSHRRSESNCERATRNSAMASRSRRSRSARRAVNSRVFVMRGASHVFLHSPETHAIEPGRENTARRARNARDAARPRAGRLRAIGACLRMVSMSPSEIEHGAVKRDEWGRCGQLGRAHAKRFTVSRSCRDVSSMRSAPRPPSPRPTAWCPRCVAPSTRGVVATATATSARQVHSPSTPLPFSTPALDPALAPPPRRPCRPPVLPFTR